jgi:hypothetical protein
MTDVNRYRRAAAKYRPDRVKLLWVAKAPPEGGERYFYFETMSAPAGDSLFREVMRAMARAAPFPESEIPSKSESKRSLLRRFQACGCFLIDLCRDPGYAVADYWWPRVSAEIVRLDPKWILPVKVDVCWYLRRRLPEISMTDRLLTNCNVPFPGSGQQTRFHRIVDPLLRKLYGKCKH